MIGKCSENEYDKRHDLLRSKEHLNKSVTTVEDGSSGRKGNPEKNESKVLDSVGKVAICLFTKESARYIDEWVDYNFAIGFHTIYLYDNNSKHKTLSTWAANIRRSGRDLRYFHFP
eukprot:scaffold438433_cov63-Attheya_sp.AAC.1